MVWLLMRLVNLDPLQDYHVFAELYFLFYDQRPPNLLAEFKEQYEEKAVMRMRMILSADDETAADIE